MELVELRDQVENLQNDMVGLTALVHAFLEGIRSDSVSIDEISHATAVLYLLMDLMTERMKSIKKDLASVD